ncbi:MAG: glycosyltransferase family 4 protein [Acidimicrobiales bacterium]
MKALFILGYPPHTAPAQRFRCEQWLRLLPTGSIDVQHESLMTPGSYSILYEPGHVARKASIVLRGLLKRVSAVARAGRFDVCFIGREAFPLGPPLVERLLERRLPVVFDLDDAIFLGDVSAANRSIARFKMPAKVGEIVELATVVTAGNSWLADWARQRAKAVEVIPTTIDVDHHKPQPQDPRAAVTVGWSGSKTTAQHLHSIDGALATVLEDPRVSVSVVGDRTFALPGSNRGVHAKSWSEAEEVADLASFDIGLMPLPDNDWSRGKCGAKALLYMAMGVVPIVSPVGVNTDIVHHGENGMIASTEAGWVEAIRLLASDPQLRADLGEQARATVVERYSGQAWAPTFLDVLERAASTRV